jgi:hypothetical protein
MKRFLEFITTRLGTAVGTGTATLGATVAEQEAMAMAAIFVAGVVVDFLTAAFSGNR